MADDDNLSGSLITRGLCAAPCRPAGGNIKL